MTFDETQRSILARLADVLIPSSAGGLSASEAGVAGEGLDQVLTVRPDLAPAIRLILHHANGKNPAETIRDLRANDAASFAALAEVVAGAYFLNQGVRAALGYDGQDARSLNPGPDDVSDGLLQPVIQRGPIYRPSPGIKHPR
jgi:hypothetical protein